MTNETGLIVVGNTQSDNNEIAIALEHSSLYGEFNFREGYWFLPEDPGNYGELENTIVNALNVAGIDARIEGVWN
jgi:hypothetical protein